MSLADRDYMRRDYNSTSKSSFRSPSRSSDRGKFSCIRCGRSYSTKKAAAACYRSHRLKTKSSNGKMKKSITESISKIIGFIWGGVKIVVVIGIVGIAVCVLFGLDYNDGAPVDKSSGYDPAVKEPRTPIDWLNLLSNDLPYRSEKIPYSKVSGSQICLTNYKNATDPTWGELITFLRKDDTDDHLYINGSFVCGDFAEMLHNNAEASGIKAALIGVDFIVGDEHALNAFNTTDNGLVYVDCTGGFPSQIRIKLIDPGNEREADREYDKIAYVVRGRRYGLIGIGKATSPEYWFYEEYMGKWDEYERELETYNRDVEEYNKSAEDYGMAVGGRTVIADPANYAELKKMYDKLNRVGRELELRYEQLQRQEDEVGMSCRWGSLGVVTDVKIYW